MKIVLISGPYGAGKDTFGDMLMNECYNIGRQRILHINFADWVKDSAMRYLNWDGNKYTEEGRTLLQYYATDLVRTQLPDYWGDVVAQLCWALRNNYDLIIITDFRFPNEYDCFLKLFPIEDIITIRIEREMPDKETRHHQSENSLNDFVFDYYIDNRGSLDSLRETADELRSKICC